MENKKIVYLSDGTKIEIEEIMSFKIDEINKTFIAYTINDDKTSEEVEVNLVEIVGYDTEKPTLKTIDEKDFKLVENTFRELLKI